MSKKSFHLSLPKTWTKLLFVLFFIPVAGVFLSLPGYSPVPPDRDWNRLATQMTYFWPDEEGCAYELLNYSGYQMISIACEGDYSAETRNRVLSYLFENKILVKEENYRLEKKSGLYLYKLLPMEVKDQANAGFLFLKIYVRNARILWPVHERKKPQIALYVQGLTTVNELIDWQTLGVNLTYGVKPGSPETGSLIEKIDSYGQEIWIAIRLESVQTASDQQVKVLEIASARDSHELGLYLDQLLPETNVITGVSSIEGSLFMNDVVSLRNLFLELRRRGIHYFLDTLQEQSGSYDTARIMSLNAYRSDVNFPEEEDKMMEAWSKATRKARETGTAIIVIEAGNGNARSFIQKHISEVEKIMEFSTLSELPDKGSID